MYPHKFVSKYRIETEKRREIKSLLMAERNYIDICSRTPVNSARLHRTTSRQTPFLLSSICHNDTHSLITRRTQEKKKTKIAPFSFSYSPLGTRAVLYPDSQNNINYHRCHSVIGKIFWIFSLALPLYRFVLSLSLSHSLGIKKSGVIHQNRFF